MYLIWEYRNKYKLEENFKQKSYVFYPERCKMLLN